MKSGLTEKQSVNNFYSFLWHAVFLALANNFMDIDTVIPAMMLDAGGGTLMLGFTAAVMIGGGQFTQLFFAPFLENRPFKLKYLLTGINIRVASLGLLAAVLYSSRQNENSAVVPVLFLLTAAFSVSGGFANVNYMDILGKSVFEHKRKKFFSIKEIISGIGVLVSAFAAREVLARFHYPENYAFLFLAASVLLAAASLGFWRIIEAEGRKTESIRLKNYLKIIISAVTGNFRLKNYLLVLNTQGVVMIIIPFMLLYARSDSSAAGTSTGNFLFLKVCGSVAAGSLMYFYSKKLSYRKLLYFTSAAGIILLLSLMIFPSGCLFPWVFSAGGIIFAISRVTASGVLLEVSDAGNRALYTGISGAGNILPGIFPVIGGVIVSKFGFHVFFATLAVILAASFYFIYKLQCRH